MVEAAVSHDPYQDWEPIIRQSEEAKVRLENAIDQLQQVLGTLTARAETTSDGRT